MVISVGLRRPGNFLDYIEILSNRNNGRAYATMLRPSVVCL